MRIVVIGGGGHAKVVIDSLQMAAVHEIVGILDETGPLGEVLGVPVLGSDNLLSEMRSNHGVIGFVPAVGDNILRRRLFDAAVSAGLEPVNAIHPTAVISRYATLGRGVALMAGVVLNADCQIGDNVIVNTGATVDHDVRVESDVHIAPGCHISGYVSIGRGTLIGTGSSVKDRVHIGERATIGAGAAVYRDVPNYATVVGSQMRAVEHPES